MHCDCCDKELNDYESTLRHRETNEFLNTCSKCLKGLSIPTRGRKDLKPAKKQTYLESFYKEVFFDEE